MTKAIPLTLLGKQDSFFSGFPTSQSLRLRRSDWEVENDGGRVPAFSGDNGDGGNPDSLMPRMTRLARRRGTRGTKSTVLVLLMPMTKAIPLVPLGKQDSFFSGFPTSQSLRLRRSDWEVENDGGRVHDFVVDNRDGGNPDSLMPRVTGLERRRGSRMFLALFRVL